MSSNLLEIEERLGERFKNFPLQPAQKVLLDAVLRMDIDEISGAFACNGPRPDNNILVMMSIASYIDEIIDELSKDNDNKYKFLAEKMFRYGNESQKVFLRIKYGINA